MLYLRLLRQSSSSANTTPSSPHSAQPRCFEDRVMQPRPHPPSLLLLATLLKSALTLVSITIRGVGVGVGVTIIIVRRTAAHQFIQEIEHIITINVGGGVRLVAVIAKAAAWVR